MKLLDRQSVAGTTPTIYIGYRSYRDRKSGRQKVSRKWYAEYCLDGCRHYEPLGTTNKNVAIRAAHEIINRIQSGKAKPPGRRVRIEDLVPDYMNLVRSKGRAPRTLEKYEYVLDQFVKWSKQGGIIVAAAFTEADFWRFNQHMIDAKLAEPTRYDRLIIVKQLFKWAARSNLISANPLLGISMQDPESPIQPCFMPDQVAVLLEKADPHEGAIFACFAYTGMRFGEVRELRWEDLLLDEGHCGFVVVRRGDSMHSTKGRRMRRIPIHPMLRKVFDRQRGLARSVARWVAGKRGWCLPGRVWRGCTEQTPRRSRRLWGRGFYLGEAARRASSSGSATTTMPVQVSQTA